jgi:hypothetical protein
MQTLFDPNSQGLDLLCPSCHGAGWVDASLVCYCGRAATFYVEKHDRWYCGVEACHPDKHPRQNAMLKESPTRVTILTEEEVFALIGFYGPCRMFY